MGLVFEAYDPRLQRQVAIKRLRDRRPEAVQRFLREARAQARVQHENVCPIFEVDEVDGEPYLVMQLVKGRTLLEAAPEMTLEQKLLTMIRVALGVHAAHREGLVHRDLKPGNVMIEPTESGEPRVFVMDFGIARPTSGGEITSDGSFMGTPAYSAPEQVRGDSKSIDRRTDVYGLGATLYRVLSGAPPFEGPTSAVIYEVLESEPKPLRPLGIPADVETIVLKCLEKDPEQRYSSAKALAEDLQRFVDGDPILARPVGLAGRLLRRARKHRAVTTTALAALLIVACALAWGGWTRWQASARERLVRDLSSQVEGIEAEIRYSNLSPLHDIRPDRERLRQRMEALRTDIAKVGSDAEAAGNYALGRASLAFEDLAEARRHLEQAWSSGARDDRAAAALGMTLSQQYRERLPEVEAIPDKDLRAQHRSELRRELQLPAVSYMTHSTGLDSESSRFLRALIAFHQRRYDIALERLSGGVSPWRYEVPLLRGDILRERAQERLDAGLVDPSSEDFAAALEAYAEARRIAQSDPRSCLSAGHTRYLQMLATELSGLDASSLLAAGLQEAEAARTIDPDDSRPYSLEAVLLHRQAESLRQRHEDPEPTLARALEAANRAAELAAEPSDAWLLVALIHTSQALWRSKAAPEAQEGAFDQALSALGKVAAPRRGYRFYNALGVAYASKGDARAVSGQDTREDYQRAIDAYRAAVPLHPNPYAALSNLSQCLLKLSSQPGVEDRVGPLREAAEALESALERHPEEVVPYCYSLGRCYVRLAQAGDPMTDLLDPASAERALLFYRRGQAANPKLPHFYSTIGEVLFLQGKQAWDDGRDPEPLFRQAETEYRQGIEVNPKFVYLHLNLAWLRYSRGKVLVREGLSPDGELRDSILEAEQALALQPNAGATLCVGSAHRILAEHAFNSGRDPRVELSTARAAFRKLLEDNPKHPTAHREIARAWTLEAQWMVETGRDPEGAFAHAVEEMRAALELQPRAPAVCLAEARRCVHQAAWLISRSVDADDLIAQGLEQADRALEVRPGLAEAEAIRACLAILREAAVGDTSGQAEHALRAALTKNPHLAFEWGSFLRGH